MTANVSNRTLCLAPPSETTLKMLALTLVVILFISLYLYGTKNFKYWSSRGIKCNKPVPFAGNNLKNFILLKSVTQTANDLYWQYPNEKVVGFYRGMNPELMIRDPELVKRVVISDFNSFHDRGIFPETMKEESMMRNLFLLDGDSWKLLRKRLTPAFTSGKLKGMFPLIVERAERLKARALAAATEGKPIDARDLMARFTTDFIGACGFGLDSDSLNDDNSPFRELGQKVLSLRLSDKAITILKMAFPNLLKNIKVFKQMEDGMTELMEEVLRKRNYQKSNRGDFVDLLLECKAKGTMVGESIERVKNDGTPETATLEFDDGLILAQIAVFFIAGFETSSSATSTTLHQLAYHPEVQRKVQEDIDSVLSKHGKLSYDAVQEMQYLEMAFKEGLRIFPSVGVLNRQAVRSYTFEDLGLTIDKGVNILIPVHALQNDPKYFDNPDEFRPERFSSSEFDSSNRYVYLPFGDGPRACIGARLGLMQSLAGLAAILSSFTVEPAPTTLRNPVVNTINGVIQNIVGGLPLIFRPRQSTCE